MKKGFKRIKIPKNLIMFILGLLVLIIGIGIIWVSSLRIPDHEGHTP